MRLRRRLLLGGRGGKTGRVGEKRMLCIGLVRMARRRTEGLVRRGLMVQVMEGGRNLSRGRSRVALGVRVGCWMRERVVVGWLKSL